MDANSLGIHHITAIASDPQANLDFYGNVLGLRLVKRTVNFDDPGTYHFYYGDGPGTPGTILTFFPWPGARRGRPGAGQATVTAFSIPAESVGFWTERLRSHEIAAAPESRWGETTLRFHDPDGMPLELVATEGETRPGWTGGPVPASHTVRGFHHTALELESAERTAALLTRTLGFRLVQTEGDRSRYEAGEGGPGTYFDLLHRPNGPFGSSGAGTIHHIALRVPNDAEQGNWRETLTELGYHVSPIMDRQYFHSIYFREPGHVLFEIATDPPGFATDETLERLGTGLMLPPWLETRRAQIEMMLPPVRLPGSEEAQP